MYSWTLETADLQATRDTKDRNKKRWQQKQITCTDLTYKAPVRTTLQKGLGTKLTNNTKPPGMTDVLEAVLCLLSDEAFQVGTKDESPTRICHLRGEHVYMYSKHLDNLLPLSLTRAMYRRKPVTHANSALFPKLQ